MKLQQIMTETIEGVVVRKNSVVILRPRKQLAGPEHAKYGTQITKWGASVGVRATLVPHDFDVMAVDDETGATLLQNEQADRLRESIALLRAQVNDMAVEMAKLRRRLEDEAILTVPQLDDDAAQAGA